MSDGKGGTASDSCVVNGVNAKPSVNANGGGACHPNCQTSVSGSASDSDGDSLSYSWSGCASGDGQNATCDITKVGNNTATLTVSDGWESASASVTSTGTNQNPWCNADTQDVPYGDYYNFRTWFGDDDGDNVTCVNTVPADCCKPVRVDTCLEVECKVICHGSFTITKKLTDQWGGTTTVNWLVRVND